MLAQRACEAKERWKVFTNCIYLVLSVGEHLAPVGEHLVVTAQQS